MYGQFVEEIVQVEHMDFLKSKISWNAVVRETWINKM